MSHRIHRFGDHVDTDQIIPARFLLTSDPAELRAGCMAGADTTFPERVERGDVVVAGRNFGCGSSREHAPLALVGAGVRAVVAHSFARIFFRNAVNVGLAVLESPEAASALEDGDMIELDLERGRVLDAARGVEYEATKLPPICAEISRAGGLMPWVRARMGQEAARWRR